MEVRDNTSPNLRDNLMGGTDQIIKDNLKVNLRDKVIGGEIRDSTSPNDSLKDKEMDKDSPRDNLKDNLKDKEMDKDSPRDNLKDNLKDKHKLVVGHSVKIKDKG